jgi:small subunit ribosomal protein S20
MPIIKSAKKRVRVARKATIRNVKTKRTLKTALKAFTSSSKAGGAKATQAQRDAQSAIDKAAKKNVIHKNKAARQKRQLAAAAKAAGVKNVGAKKVAKAAPVKKAPAKAKKPAAKKPAAKKPAAKK